MKSSLSLVLFLIISQSALASEASRAISVVRREFNTAKNYQGKSLSPSNNCTVQTEKIKDGGLKLTIKEGKKALSFTISTSDSLIQGFKDFGSQSIIYQTYTPERGNREIAELSINNFNYGNILKSVSIKRHDGTGLSAYCNVTNIIKK